MCIIAIKPYGIELPDEETIRTCFENNPDGAGIMYAGGFTEIVGNTAKYQLLQSNGVKIEKGFMTVDALLERLRQFKKPSELIIVIHFRVGTHGNKDAETTHPFPITSNRDRLRTTSLITNVGIAHNGIIHKCSTTKGDVLSDTQIFIKNYLSCLNLQEGFTPKLLNLISDVGGMTNKFCLLNKFGELAIVGDFINAEGILYSNTSYMKRVPITHYPKRRWNRNERRWEDEYDQSIEDFINYGRYLGDDATYNVR